MTIDDRLKRAGERLAAKPIAVPDYTSLRQRPPFRRGLAAGVCSLIAVGAVYGVSQRSSPDASLSVGSPQQTCERAVEYELLVAGATAKPPEQLDAGISDTAVWFDSRDTSYLALTVRAGLGSVGPDGPAGLGPLTADTELTPNYGQAWFFSEETEWDGRSQGMWWSRPDGDVWILRVFWRGDRPIDAESAQRRLRDLALGISTSTTEPVYSIAEDEIALMAKDTAGLARSRTFSWSFQTGVAQSSLVTLVIVDGAEAAGRANLLAIGEPQDISVNGCMAWRSTASDGAIHVGWEPGESSDDWATLVVPPPIASEADLIVDSVRTR